MNKPWNKPHNTNRENLTIVILSGLRSLQAEWTLGELCDECDEVLKAVTFKDENKEGE